jgi:hypothetical protein
MSKSKELLSLVEAANSDVEVVNPGAKATTERGLVQFTAGGNSARAVGKTKPTLEAGVYRIESDMSGVYFTKHKFATDELLRFKDGQYEHVLKEIEEFWKLTDAFKQFGYTATRGMLLHGFPGTGKSCLIKIVMEHIVNQGDLVFCVKDVYSLTEGLKILREVENDRKAFVVMEDIDGIIGSSYAERTLLELLDGDSQQDDVLYIGTTNYLNTIPERVKRPGRFDKIIEIKFPPIEGRRAYLKHKLAKYETEQAIESIATATEGLGFNHLKELILCTYVFKEDMGKVIRRLRGTVPQGRNDRYVERALAESFNRVLDEAKALDVLAENDAAVMQNALTARIDKLGFEGVTVNNVDVAPDGDITVTFQDDEGNVMDVLFGVDGDGKTFAMVLDQYEGDDNVIVIDLDPLSPPTFENGFGTPSVDLQNLGWLNTSTVDTILRSGDILSGGEKSGSQDAFGNEIVSVKGEHYALRENKIGDMIVERIMARVVRGGKAVKLPILKGETKINLTPRQRESLTKVKKESVQRKRSIQLRRKAK